MTPEDRFMTVSQKLTLGLVVISASIMILLWLTPPLRPYHVFPEGVMIAAGAALVSSFRRVYGLTYIIIATVSMLISRILELDGYHPTNISYIYLTASIVASFFIVVSIKPRHGP